METAREVENRLAKRPQCYGLLHDPKETECMGGGGKLPCIYQEGCGKARQKNITDCLASRKKKMPKRPEWVTISKEALEDLLSVADKDPTMKSYVEKIREGLRRGGGKTSTWANPLPRSAEG